ncbi:MAG: c-type cytochrome [Hyphomicrobiaceae bacterium]
MEFNKFAGAVLAALLVAFGGSTLIHELVAHKAKSGEKAAQEVASAAPERQQTAAASSDAAPTRATTSAPTAAAEASFFAEVQPLLASASAEAGRNVFGQCRACHTPDEGGANRVGPNLWGVVGRDVASVDGFRYSNAFAAIEGAWTYEKLVEFTHAPRRWAPGNRMAFNGISRPQDMANLMAYLQSLSSDPVPFETAAAEPVGQEQDAPQAGDAQQPAAAGGSQ